jgi:ribosomal protein S17E
MEKDFKEAIEKSKASLKDAEKVVSETAGELSENVAELWGKLQTKMDEINLKLEGSYKDWEKESDEAKLQANLGAMEAHDKMKEIKESLEEFADKVSQNAHSSLDTVALKAHLAKKEAEALWDEKAPVIQKEFEESKEKVSQVAVEAIDEITSFFNKVASNFTEEKKKLEKTTDLKEKESSEK